MSGRDWVATTEVTTELSPVYEDARPILVTPARDSLPAWTVTSRPTPLADFFGQYVLSSAALVCVLEIMTTGDAKSKCYYHGRWEALSDLSDYSEPADETPVHGAAFCFSSAH